MAKVLSAQLSIGMLTNGTMNLVSENGYSWKMAMFHRENMGLI
jgi:hypothetical protein